MVSIPKLCGNLRSLPEISEIKDPALCLIQGSSFMEVCCVFGDASVSSLGSSWNRPGSNAVSYIFGILVVEGENTSSNFREFRNLVETL